ncbi:MAG: hypothetical protein HY814_15430 [Candidatus Riflebacteria bacterium]|nr:hypothetical protein [Candidatus Riflebacteria bacterium]
MGWILVLMVLIPTVAFGGLALYAVERSASRRRMLGGNPEAERLLERAERALQGIEEAGRLQLLPASTTREVLAHARELTTKSLPALLQRHTRLRARVQAYAPGTDAERQRALAQLAAEFSATERTLETLVGGLETLDAQLASSEALTGDEVVARSASLVERLRLVQETCRELEEEKKKCLEP